MKELLIGMMFTLMLAAPAAATEISTHVLDLTSGKGGEDIPVVLSKKEEGKWVSITKSKTGENGRIKQFVEYADFKSGTYKLTFDMTSYDNGSKVPFFPEIDVIFMVDEKTDHYHVPVVVSPFGYSTYRGN
ncbi:hydroxyisourate hydrolase [uncultured Algoriphagus sp.]|uniref:hydroxyisourate hydrolase n=1 Tax=uncultured Algoriphagus sp. TaxID=417365 RepID=UPI0030EF0EA2|tara:strand:+ start:3112 stop:3504 length:393 start_codon:yes stop_codon:yes gene_type:complete